MNRKVVISTSLVGLLMSLVLILYGAYGPHYKTDPLRSSFSFANEEPQRFRFGVGKSEKYMIEIHLKNVLPDEKMNSIVGDFVSGGKGGKIDVEWHIEDENELLAKGSNKKYGYSPIFGPQFSGLTAGEVSLRKGKVYSLILHVNSVDPDWDVTEPHVEVGLHPAKLEYLLGYSVLGFLLLVMFGLAVCLFSYRAIKRKGQYTLTGAGGKTRQTVQK